MTGKTACAQVARSALEWRRAANATQAKGRCRFAACFTMSNSALIGKAFFFARALAL
jgi:hypothetical protein